MCGSFFEEDNGAEEEPKQCARKSCVISEVESWEMKSAF